MNPRPHHSARSSRTLTVKPEKPEPAPGPPLTLNALPTARRQLRHRPTLRAGRLELGKLEWNDSLTNAPDTNLLSSGLVLGTVLDDSPQSPKRSQPDTSLALFSTTPTDPLHQLTGILPIDLSASS